MIIGITGTNGAGKGVVVEYLVAQKDFFHFSSSGYLAEELARRGMEKTRPNLRAIGNEFRERYGSGYLADRALAEMRERGAKHLVMESIRSTGEARKIKDAGGTLWLVDADRKLRYDRIFSRKSEKDMIDFDTFVEQEEREWYGAEGEHDMNVKAVMAMADYTIMNDGTLKELHAQVDAVLATLTK